jgi:ketosteroid isomerase-like protein
MPSTNTIEVFKSMTAALSRLDFDAIFSLIADDIEGYFPYLPDPYPKRTRGRAEFESVFAFPSTVLTEFSWTSMEILTTEQPPGVVVARASSVGTLRNGASYSNDYVFFVRTVDPKLVEYREYFDVARLLLAIAALES